MQQGLSKVRGPGEFAAARQVQHQGRESAGRASPGIIRQDVKGSWEISQLMIWSAGSVAKHRHTYDVPQAETKHPWLRLNEAPEPMDRGLGRSPRWRLLNPIGSLRPPDTSQWNIQTHIFMHKQEKRRIMIVVWPVLRFLTPECLIAQPRYYSNAVSTHSLYKHRGC